MDYTNYKTTLQERIEMDLQYYNNDGDTTNALNIENANPNGANSMTRNAMDFNYRQMAKVAETCINNRDCMRVLYHNIYNTNKRGELKQAMYGEVIDKLTTDGGTKPRDIFTHSIVSQSNNGVNTTIPNTQNGVNTILPNNEYYIPHNTKKSNTYTSLQ